MRYRLFIDESGTHALKGFEDANDRYLSLTAIAIEWDYYHSGYTTDFNALKDRHFGHHAPAPVLLHRKELVQRTIPPFDVLADVARLRAFNADFLGFVATQNYVAFTSTIDKKEHVERYSVWRYDPYHYCFEILMERYLKWLERVNGTGDVLCEARHKNSDKKLKNLYRKIWEGGTDYVSAQRFQDRLTTRELKFGTKPENILGLQFVDLIAHPCRALHVARSSNIQPPNNFGSQVSAILEASKHDRYGWKWLP